MTIKKLGKMGAILGLCLSITIVSFINGIENHLIKAKAETIDDTKSDIDFINQVNDITIHLNAKTLLSDEELQDLIKIGKISNVSCDYNFTGNKADLYNIINLNSNIYTQDEENYSLISDIANDEIRKYIEEEFGTSLKKLAQDDMKKEERKNVSRKSNSSIRMNERNEKTKKSNIKIAIAGRKLERSRASENAIRKRKMAEEKNKQKISIEEGKKIVEGEECEGYQLL